LSIWKRLLLLVLGVALPFAAIAILVVFVLTSTERDVQRANLLVSTRTLAAMIDAELETYISLGYTLSVSPTASRDDVEAFYTFAKSSISRWSTVSVILATADGHQVFNTEFPFGQSLPDVADRVFFDKAAQTHRALISDLHRVQTANNKYAVSVYVPLISEGRSTHCIVVAVDVKTFERLLQKQKLPPGWISAIIDGKGVLIARNPGHDRFVGHLSVGKWKDLAKIVNRASFESVSLEGVPNYSTLVNSSLTNWSASVAAAQDAMMAPFQTSLSVLLAVSLCAAVISVFVAFLLSKKITTPLNQLEKASLAMIKNERLSFNPNGLPEVDNALSAFKSASHDIGARDEKQRKSVAQLQLLTDELNHRVKNVLPVIQSIALISAKSAQDVKEFSRNFIARVHSISRTHDAVTRASWEAVDLDEILKNETVGFQNEAGTRITLDGPELQLPSRYAMDLGMVIHELTTNAVKYGALKEDSGRLSVAWRVLKDRLIINWVEQDEPPAIPPEKRGFWWRLIQREVNAHL